MDAGERVLATIKEALAKTPLLGDDGLKKTKVFFKQIIDARAKKATHLGDGDVTDKEFRAELEKIGVKLSNEDFIAVMHKIDRTGSGIVDQMGLDHAMSVFEKKAAEAFRPEMVITDADPFGDGGATLGAHNFGERPLESRTSLACTKSDPNLKANWTEHWGQGRYFKPRYNEMDPELRGSPWIPAITSARRTEFDHFADSVRRRSLPMKEKFKYNGWVQHWGDGRYFERPEERCDPALRGTGVITVKFRDDKEKKGRTRSAGPNVGKVDSPASEADASPRGKSWKRVSGQQRPGFNPRTRENGLQDCTDKKIVFRETKN